MKKILKKTLVVLLHPLIVRLGYKEPASLPENSKFIDTTKNSLLAKFFDLTRQAGFAPNHIVDIGANHGTWTREVLKVFPEATYTLLEPVATMRSSVRDLLDNNPKIRYYSVGAYSRSGTLTFTHNSERDDSGSFRFTPEEARQRGFVQEKIPVVALDDLIVRERLCVPDILKIDAEGLDLDVLEGCTACLGKTEVILVEAAVVSPVFGNTVLATCQAMDAKGYKLFDITDLNRPFVKEVLWLVEMAFVKKGGLMDTCDWKSRSS